MKSISLLSKKLSLFYEDIVKKRDPKKEMRIQIDRLPAQNEIKTK